MEFFDVLDEEGKKTGAIVERNEAHAKGLRHRVVQVWVLNSNHQILLQKTSPNKDSYPNMCYVSLGWHIESFEDNRQTIIREFNEELGLDISKQIEELQYLYTFEEKELLNGGKFIDHEFYDVYLLEMDLDPSKLVLQEEEVSEVKFMDYKTFKDAVHKKDKSIWIHEEGFRRLLDKLDVIIKG